MNNVKIYSYISGQRFVRCPKRIGKSRDRTVCFCQCGTLITTILSHDDASANFRLDAHNTDHNNSRLKGLSNEPICQTGSLASVHLRTG